MFEDRILIADPVTNVVMWLATLYFGSYLARLTIVEAQFDQLSGHVKLEHLSVLERIL